MLTIGIQQWTISSEDECIELVLNYLHDRSFRSEDRPHQMGAGAVYCYMKISVHEQLLRHSVHVEHANCRCVAGNQCIFESVVGFIQ